MPKFLRDDIGGLPPDATELYYTIQVKNNNTGFDSNGQPVTTQPAVPIVFQETRSNPYVNPAGDYYMSVISFEVDTEAIPVFICDAIPGSTEKKQTSYYVTIGSGSVTPVSVIWEPEDLTASFPPIPVPDNYDNYPYYYSYTFQHFINLVNTALATAASIAGASKPPFLVLNDNQLSLVGKLSEYGTGIGGQSIYFNGDLYNLFSSLPARKIPDANQPTGALSQCNYRLIMQPYPSGSNVRPVYTNLAEVPPTTSYQAVFSDCEYSPFPLWNPVDSIVFTTQQLTVVPELIAKPIAFGLNNTENIGTNAESYYILTDYATPLTFGTEYKPNITYEPNAEFRLADLYGDQALNSLRISLFWKDKFGELHPLYLEAGGTAYIKILFRKKTYYVDKEKK